MHVFAALSLLALRERGGGGGGLQQEKFIGCFCGRGEGQSPGEGRGGEKAKLVVHPFSQAVCGR
jgi:hypothetical protein